MGNQTSQNVFIIIFISFFINACSTPIFYTHSKIILPNDPIVPISKLNDQSQPDEVIKAWVATAIAYRNWSRIVRKQIELSQ